MEYSLLESDPWNSALREKHYLHVSGEGKRLKQTSERNKIYEVNSELYPYTVTTGKS